MEKEWISLSPLTEEEKLLAASFTELLKCPPMIAELLIRRGLKSDAEIEGFFAPDLAQQHSPFLFKDMEIAVARIIRAIENKEKITIYGDYDVDGATATALLLLGLTRVGAIVDFYIPHRMIDGYGLSLSSLDYLKDSGSKLIVSVDCGVNALEEIAAINEMGMEIIITDHHNPKDELPTALAIINPKLADSGYPFPHLAGVGVAFKLLMAVYERLGITSEENTLKYLDLVAVGTIADIVPLTDENRIFAHIGLQHLINKKNLGLNALIQISGLNQKNLDSNDIVFGIAPRINAAGRMGSASIAVNLLISREEKESEVLAEVIERQPR